MAPLAVTLTVDVVCPFSYLGCSRLFEALVMEEVAPALLAWTVEPVLTIPSPRSLSDDGQTEATRSSARYGDPAVLHRRVERLIARSGVTVRSGVSSERAHVLLTHTPDPELLRRLFKAHFDEGRDISSMGELCEIAAEQGIAREVVIELLENPERAAEVRTRAARYADMQTPRIRINGSAPFVGVQAVETYRRALAHGRRA